MCACACANDDAVFIVKIQPGTDDVGATSEAHIEQAADIFNQGLEDVQRDHPDWSDGDQLQAAFDRYLFTLHTAFSIKVLMMCIDLL